MPYGDVILLSKLVKPDISGKLVPRVVFTTFAEKLLNGMKVGLVIAPAGYGKSTLLSQSFDLLINREVHCAWLSLDTEDNDPLRFLSHLLAACHTLSPLDFQVETESLGANSKNSIDYTVTDTITKLEALDFRHAIFIDDYHVIDNPEVHSMLERLVLYSPGTTMFIFASRKEPKLAFKTLKMREEVCHLSTEDLAFAQSESEQFLNEAKQLGLNSQQVESLFNRTEGWVAGLQLASLALAGRTDPEKFIEEFSGTDRDITDYLGEAVLSQQSEDIRHFLLWTSLLERMNADLANAVLGIESAQSILEQLEARNLFVIPLDRDRTWYRYHHLFGDFLKAQLAKKHPGIAEVVCQSALAWCVKQGLQHEAIHYALRGQFYYQAIELIAEIAKDLLQISGEHWTMLHWLQQLPDDYALKRPEIAVAYSWSLVFTRQYTEARDLLDKQEKHCEQQATPLELESVRQLRYGIKLNKCLLETACDNTERASELLKEWLNDNPKADPRDLTTVYVLQAYSSLSTFELELGIAAADKAISIGEEYALDYFEAWGRACAGMLKMQQGDLDEAIRHYKKGLQQNNRKISSFSYMGSLNTVLLAEACYEKNDLDQAEALLQDRFEYIDSESVVNVAYAGYRVMVRLQFIQSGLEAGLNVLRLGKESAIRARLPRLSALLSALEIRNLLKAGRSKEARKIAKESGFDESQAPSLQKDSRPATMEIRELVQADLCLDRKLPKRALQILDASVIRLENTGRQRRLLAVLLLRTRAFHVLQKPDDAMTDLVRALEIGSKGGFYRLFLDAGEEIHQLVRRLLKKSSSGLSAGAIKFLGKINVQLLADLKSKQGNTLQVESTSALLETLTKRERQMIDAIVTGETNKEIAEKLFISEQTVKWHIHQLYQKFGVKNRASAIAKATALSLI